MPFQVYHSADDATTTVYHHQLLPLHGPERFPSPYVPTRNSSLGRILLQVAAWCKRTLWRCPLLYGIGLELCTAPHRIQALFAYIRTPYIDPGPEMGIEASGHPVYCMQRHCRTVDRQTLRTMWPWATPVEELAFLEGWDRGADWGARTHNREERGNMPWRDQCIGDCSRPNRWMRRR
jgi:hypothetical protein